jgi:hypothetical protein
MTGFAVRLEDLRSLISYSATHDEIAAKLEPLGGVLRCRRCGRECELGDIATKLRHGWPVCHGETMEWVTASQLAEEGSS